MYVYRSHRIGPKAYFIPKLAIYRNPVFFLVAYDLSERWHVHVANSKSDRTRAAKIWLDTLEVFEQGNLSKKEINLAAKVLDTNKEKILDALREFAAGGKTHTLRL